MTRRDLLTTSLAALAASGLPRAATPRVSHEPHAAGFGDSAGAESTEFSFVHLTDTHIQPELRAAEGCARCLDRVNQLDPAFVINGGDLVFDAAEVGPARARAVFDLYLDSAKRLRAPLHHVVGNHDVFGVAAASGVSPSDPMYGKRMYEDRIGRRYYAFEHAGWRFILLDSIFLTPDRSFVGRIDEAQLAWLASELAAMPAGQPLVVATHVPLATSFLQFAESKAPPDTLRVVNAREVLALLWRQNLKAVLQGHTHVREIAHYNGCQFITSGAVCGNWWKGARLGHPEGFGVVTIRGGELSWRYETFGFQADATG
jgi:3',5'-cyclic AMP phosphodiesterase CpdA